MIFWVLLSGFFLCAAGIILIPLFRYRNKNCAVDSHALDVYKAQLRELEADQNNNVLNEADRASARLEIERRLLRGASDNERAEKSAMRPAQAVFSTSFIGVTSLVILLISVGLYFIIGKPGMPDFLLKDQPYSKAKWAEKNPDSQDIMAKIIKIKEHLAQNPNDSAAWRSLGQYNIKLQNRAAVAKAFEHLYTLEPNNIDAIVAYAESLITLSNGKVEPAAMLMLNKAHKLQPQNPGTRHYMALAKYQDGRLEQALSDWQNLEAQSTPDAPWLPLVRGWIRRVQSDLSIQTNAPDSDSIDQMTEEQQTAFIKSMVARLQKKMDNNPTNIEGWLQLAKAYGVLGQTQDAIRSLESAYKYAPENQKAKIKKQLEIFIKKE